MRNITFLSTFLGLVLAFYGGFVAADDQIWPGYFTAEIHDRMMERAQDEIDARAEVCGLAVYACERATGFQCEAVYHSDTVGMTGYFWAAADFKCSAGLSAEQPTVGGLQ